VLLDPNTLSSDGTIALSGYETSWDGKLLAYGLSAAGSDWTEWKVRDVETGKDLSDDLKWIKFSGAAWSHDNKGFYYSRYAEPRPGQAYEESNYFNKLYYHRIGTPQSEDTLVYERPDQKEWLFGGTVTEDGRYLVITVNRSSESKNMVLYKDLEAPESEIGELIRDFENEFSFIGSQGSTLFFKTTMNAPRGRVVSIDIQDPAKESIKEIVPQTADIIDSISMLNHQLVVSYLHDARSLVRIFDLRGKKVRDLDLPEIGSVEGFTGRQSDTETFYAFTSFTTPKVIYRYDLKTGQSSVFRKPKLTFRPEDFETHQIFYKGKDGTRIPMFIVLKKGLRTGDKTPCYLYGYGGFNISMTPSFHPGLILWLEMGGIYAMPNIRGGGEYGEEWHQAGTKDRKQNVFDDFIAAAEWLISNHYTSTPKLAIAGGSNGGLLVGACMTQRPDLFGAALPAVGVMDMLRYNKFTIGWAWAEDYGTSDNPEEFKALYEYSPLHNIKPGVDYPPTFITTADHDDRVVPAHSFKFAATLQAAQAGPAPILIRVETRAGHGSGKPTTKIIEELADRYSFLVKVLGMKG
jgi:prolyl oligopeptidase